MSSKKKRTISELMKSRPKGRFSPGGFDLLGEGERLFRDSGSRRDEDQDLESPTLLQALGDAVRDRPEANFTIDKNAILKSDEKSSIAESAMVNSATEEYAPGVSLSIADSAIEETAVDKSSIEHISMAKNAIEKTSIVKSSVAETSIDNSSIVKSAMHKRLGLKKKTTHTRDHYRESLKEVERLRQKGEGSTTFDNYIFDTLISSFKNPSQAILYIYLWRRTIGMGILKIEISYQILAEALGISKRTIQILMKNLEQAHLVKVSRKLTTGVLEYTILQPWRKHEKQ